MDSAAISWSSSLKSTGSIIASVEFKRIASRHGGQFCLQGFGISHTGGLISSSLGLQAGQLLVAELHTDQLRFGCVLEFVGVVVNVVDFDGGHGSVLK